MKSKGLGDSIEKVLKATGIDKVAKKVLGDDCGCNERKEILNKIFPYARPFTEDEIKIYEEVLPSIGKGMINGQEQKSLLKIYNKVFNTNQQPTSCTACIKPVLSKLKKVYQNSCKL
tara:strand:+ start:930 stop:1280 length:351 start_codon:yes stop_codon:yes gene_type:complete